MLECPKGRNAGLFFWMLPLAFILALRLDFRLFCLFRGGGDHMPSYPYYVHRRTVGLLEAYAESLTVDGYRPAPLPKVGKQWVTMKSEQAGVVAITYVELEGEEYQPLVRVRPLRVTQLEEFHILFVTGFTACQQAMLLAPYDPWLAFEGESGKDAWWAFLVRVGVYKQWRFDAVWLELVAALDREVRHRILGEGPSKEVVSVEKDPVPVGEFWMLETGYVPKPDDDEELFTWREIAGEVGRNVQFAKRLVINMRMPVSMLGSSLYTTRGRIRRWKHWYLRTHLPYADLHAKAEVTPAAKRPHAGRPRGSGNKYERLIRGRLTRDGA